MTDLPHGFSAEKPMTIAQAYAVAYANALRRTNENRALSQSEALAYAAFRERSDVLKQLAEEGE